MNVYINKDREIETEIMTFQRTNHDDNDDEARGEEEVRGRIGSSYMHQTMTMRF